MEEKKNIDYYVNYITLVMITFRLNKKDKQK